MLNQHYIKPKQHIVLMTENLENIVEQSPKKDRTIVDKAKEYLQRYGVAEVISKASFAIGYKVAYDYSRDELFASYVATQCGNLGFYGPIVIRDIVGTKRQYNKDGKKFGAKDLGTILGKCALEFGPTGVIDTLVTRPLITDAVTTSLGTEYNLFGSILADIFFYVGTTRIYEWIKSKKS